MASWELAVSFVQGAPSLTMKLILYQAFINKVCFLATNEVIGSYEYHFSLLGPLSGPGSSSGIKMSKI